MLYQYTYIVSDIYAVTLSLPSWAAGTAQVNSPQMRACNSLDEFLV